MTRVRDRLARCVVAALFPRALRDLLHAFSPTAALLDGAPFEPGGSFNPPPDEPSGGADGLIPVRPKSVRPIAPLLEGLCRTTNHSPNPGERDLDRGDSARREPPSAGNFEEIARRFEGSPL